MLSRLLKAEIKLIQGSTTVLRIQLMNVDEFNKFISTEEGKARKNNFAPLFGFGTGDADYYIETTREEVSRIRKENNRHAYLKRLEKESGCVTVSLNELDLYGEKNKRIELSIRPLL